MGSEVLAGADFVGRSENFGGLGEERVLEAVVDDVAVLDPVGGYHHEPEEERDGDQHAGDDEDFATGDGDGIAGDFYFDCQIS